MTSASLDDTVLTRVDAALRVIEDSKMALGAIVRAMRRDDHPRLNSALRLAHVAGFTLDELGKMVGLTRERVRQRIEAGDRRPSCRLEISDDDVARLSKLRAQAEGRNPKRIAATTAYRAALSDLHDRGATWEQIGAAMGFTAANARSHVMKFRRDTASDLERST